MPSIFVLLVGASLVVPSVWAMPTRCPLTQQGETADDCPWAADARAFEAAARQHQDFRALFKKLAPGIAHQLRRESGNAAVHALWGESINYDEYAHGTIVEPELMDLMLGMIHAPARHGLYQHAGTEHTYGYLFSTLQTPFGYKRARWIRPDIENGLGVPRGMIGPSPTHGTLIGNVTYFFGRIALRDDPRAMKILERDAHHVPVFFRHYDFSQLKITRLEETITMPAKDNAPARRVVLRTDLVPFMNAPEKGNTHLLLYSVLDSAKPNAELITGFPVESSFVTQALDPKGLGDSKPIITRYNGYVEGVTGQTWTGSRRVIQ